jgi:hypothetical protein
MFFFIDETGFKESLVALYGYSKRRSPARIVSGKNGGNYSLICAITDEQVLGFHVFKESVKAQDFGCF